VPPEAWLLPYLLPFHPGSAFFFSVYINLVCHRYDVYIYILPLSAKGVTVVFFNSLPLVAIYVILCLYAIAVYNVLQGGCGVIVEWCICQCATFMGRGLSAESHHLCWN
jgi:hypothetical protein